VAGITRRGIVRANSDGSPVGSIWQLPRAEKPMIVPLSGAARTCARLKGRCCSRSASFLGRSSKTIIGDGLADAWRTKR
jgi:hypothetical protein